MYFVLCTFAGENFKSSYGDRYVLPNGGLLVDECQQCEHVAYWYLYPYVASKIFTVLCDQKLAQYANV